MLFAAMRAEECGEEGPIESPSADSAAGVGRGPVPCRRRCSVCHGLHRDTSVKQGQVAHLDQDRTNHSLDNLAFLCLPHHDEYDGTTSQSKGLTAAEVRRFRKELHEVIAAAWRVPVQLAGVLVAPLGVSGKYVRETDSEYADLEVTEQPTETVRVVGWAVWGTKREFGPNLGDVEFEAPMVDRTVTFVDERRTGEPYRLEIRFEASGAVAREQYAVGYFGMNVSFDGTYRRL